MDMFDELYKIDGDILFKREDYRSWYYLGRVFNISVVPSLLDIVFIQLVDKDPIYLNSQKIRVA